MKKALFVLVACSVFGLAPLSANAAVDYFLTIDGVTGGSVDINHKGAIDVLTFDWGLSVASPIGSVGGGGSTSKPSFSDLRWEQNVDSAVPTLMYDAAAGKPLATAVLDAVQVGAEKPFTYFSMTFSHAFVTSLSLSGYSGGPTTADASLAYGMVSIRVNTLNPNGSPGKSYAGSWDLTTNKGTALFTGSPVVFQQLANLNAPVVSAVPAPSSYALMGLGLLGLMVLGRRAGRA